MRRLLMTNLRAFEGPVWLVTVTAPGDDELPRVWIDEDTGEVHAAPYVDGVLAFGMTQRGRELLVDPALAAEWNRTAQRRWTQLHRWAYQSTARKLGRGPHPLAYAWQVQRRGVLHLHLVLAFDDAGDREAAKAYVSRLRARRREFGFGYIDARDRGDGSTVMESKRAAGYLSAYLSKSSQLLEAIALEHRPRRLIWVSPKLTAITACTMRRMRRVRFLWWLRKGSRLFCEAGRLPAWFRDADELAKLHRLARRDVALC